MSKLRFWCSVAILLVCTILFARQFPDVTVPARTEYYGGSLDATLLEDEIFLTCSTTERIEIFSENGKHVFSEVVYAKENYGEILPVEMLSGSFRLETGTAVIGEHAATKLFLTANAVGKIIYISGTAYVISGVYHESEKGCMLLSSGTPQVFVKNPNRDITFAAILDDNIPDKTELLHLLKTSFTEVSLSNEAALASLPRCLFGFLFILFALIYTVGLMLNLWKRISAIAAKKRLKEYPLVYRNPLFRHIFTLLFMSCAFVIFLCFFHLPDLPQALLTPDGLLLPKNFFSALSTHLQHLNNLPLSSTLRSIRLSGIVGLCVYSPLSLLCFWAFHQIFTMSVWRG